MKNPQKYVGFFEYSMLVFSDIGQVGIELKDGALAIGNFDGVHRGHQALLEKVCDLAPEGKRGVLTFVPHPTEILNPKKNFFYLASKKQKLELFENLGVSKIITQKISKKFLQISKQDFINNILVKDLKIKHVIVGKDFSFGYQGSGGVKDLQGCLKFITYVIPDKLVSNIKCSSTNIRKLLALGDCIGAKNLLGRYFSVRGKVVAGDGRGQVLGIRTANIIPDSGFGMRLGVYATKILVGKKKFYYGCTNIGTRPTFTSSVKIFIETHLFDFAQDLYNQDIEIYFYNFVRSEKKFSSPKDLCQQIKKDILICRSYLEKV